MPVVATTELPDAEQPTLGNGVEDEVAVDWTDVTDYGDYRVQIRETGQSTWNSGATGFVENIVGEAIASTVFVNREDGEEYEVRMRTETEHVIGTWTTPVSIITKFPGATNLTATAVSSRKVELTWTDNADNEDGQEVIRERLQADGTYTGQTIIADAGVDAVAYDDSGVQPRTQYRYRIKPYTEDTSAESNTTTATTSDRAFNELSIRSTGWDVAVRHPDTGRIIRPPVLDNPEINPSLLGFAEIRIPVRQNPEWLTPDFDDTYPEMRVWKDGERQPIEELRNVEPDLQEGRTILVGKGGVELEKRIQREYRSARRPPSVESVIQTETSYVADVDDPGLSASEVRVQNEDSTNELNDVLNPADDTIPMFVENGEVKTNPVSWPVESSNLTRSNTSLQQNDAYSGGEAESINDATGSLESPTITVEHTIPESEVLVLGRMTTASPGTAAGGPGLVFSLNGDSWKPVSDNAGFQNVGWRDFAQQTYGGSGTYSGGDLTPGNYTVRVDGDSTGDGQVFDVFGIADARYVDPNTIDNTLNTAGGYLDGPRIHPEVDAVFADYESPFSITGGRATLTINDTSGAQRVQVSNDRGQNYYPQDGSEDNTSNVDVTFPSVGSTLRLRVRLDAYSPQGARNQTPRLNYESQAIDAYELFGDIEQELLFINEKRDESIKDFLNHAAGDEQYLWSFNVNDAGDFQVSWTQPGLRTADRDPELGEVRVQKDLQTYESVTIKGSPQGVSGEIFTASSTFVSLVNTNIQTGTETVYDEATGTQFERDTDYEIDYTAGEIRAISGGGLTATQNYRIDYRHEVSGTYELPSAPTNPDELIRQVPGVTSDRQAAQIAWVLATKYDTPRYAASVQIPRPDVTFDVLEALTLENLDLPPSATPLEVRDPPALTPRGLALQLGTRAQLEQELSDIATQVRRVSERS